MYNKWNSARHDKHGKAASCSDICHNKHSRTELTLGMWILGSFDEACRHNVKRKWCQRRGADFSPGPTKRAHIAWHMSCHVTSPSSLCDGWLRGWVSADQSALSRAMRRRLAPYWSVRPGLTSRVLICYASHETGRWSALLRLLDTELPNLAESATIGRGRYLGKVAGSARVNHSMHATYIKIFRLRFDYDNCVQ